MALGHYRVSSVYAGSLGVLPQPVEYRSRANYHAGLLLLAERAPAMTSSNETKVRRVPPRRFNKLYNALAEAAVEFGATDTISVGVSLKVRKGMPLKIRVTPLRRAPARRERNKG